MKLVLRGAVFFGVKKNFSKLILQISNLFWLFCLIVCHCLLFLSFLWSECVDFFFVDFLFRQKFCKQVPWVIRSFSRFVIFDANNSKSNQLMFSSTKEKVTLSQRSSLHFCDEKVNYKNEKIMSWSFIKKKWCSCGAFLELTTMSS